MLGEQKKGNEWGSLLFCHACVFESLLKEIKPYNLHTTILCPCGRSYKRIETRQQLRNDQRRDGQLLRHNEIPASSFARTVLFAISQPEKGT